MASSRRFLHDGKKRLSGLELSYPSLWGWEGGTHVLRRMDALSPPFSTELNADVERLMDPELAELLV